MKTLSLIALGFFAITVSVVAAEDYEIKLNRPAKPGQRFSISVKGKDESKTTVETEGTLIKSDRKELEIEYDAEVTVLEVGKNGRTTKESHKVTRLVRLVGGEKLPLADKGVVVIATRKNKKPSFEITGATSTKELTDALALAIDVNDGTGPNEDEIIGSRERRKIGESWPVNAEMLGKILSQDNAMQVANARGEFKLAEVVKEATGEAIVIEGTVKGTASFPIGPGFAAKDSALEIKLSARFPIDTSLPRTQERNELNLDIKASGKPNADGPEVLLKVVAKRVVSRKQTVLK